MNQLSSFFRVPLAFMRVPHPSCPELQRAPLNGAGFDFRLLQVATLFRTQEARLALPALFAGRISFPFPFLAAEGIV
jgi:hypothetical protein